jgi:hypothetical protein
MPEKNDPKELHEIKKLLLSHMLHLEAVTRHLWRGRYFPKKNFSPKLKQVNQEIPDEKHEYAETDLSILILRHPNIFSSIPSDIHRPPKRTQNEAGSRRRNETRTRLIGHRIPAVPQ